LSHGVLVLGRDVFLHDGEGMPIVVEVEVAVFEVVNGTIMLTGQCLREYRSAEELGVVLEGVLVLHSNFVIATPNQGLAELRAALDTLVVQNQQVMNLELQ
jgi:hypothetical protein